jgi:hypothetical protein
MAGMSSSLAIKDHRPAHSTEGSFPKRSRKEEPQVLPGRGSSLLLDLQKRTRIPTGPRERNDARDSINNRGASIIS